MNCPQDDEISAYVDAMQAPVARQRFAAHLHTCPICRQRLDALSRLRQALQALPSPALGFDLAARLEQQLRGGVRPRPPRSFWLNWGAPGLAAACSVAAGVWLGAMLIGGGAMAVPAAAMVRVFDPVPPGGLCAAAELCRASKGMP